MAITEQSRHRLRIHLEETMGEEQASAMMNHLLPVGWTDLATSAEVAEFQAATTREFAAVRAEMASEFAAVRGEIAQLREWATVRFDQMKDRFDQMATKAELERGFRRQTWALVATVCSLNGLTIAAMRFA